MDVRDRLGRRHTAALALFSASIVAVLVVTAGGKETKLRELPLTRVTTERVQRTDLQPTVEVTGRLRPARRAVLNFQVNGQIAERAVEPGQTVDAGDPLLVLEDGDFADALALADAQSKQERVAVARDRRLLELAEQNRQLQADEVERLETLRSQSLASRSQLGSARQRLMQLRSEEARLRYSVETAEERRVLREADRSRAARNLARSRLMAPFAGTVNQVHFQVGDYVTPARAAVELIDTRNLDLYAEVSARAAAALALRQVLPISAAGQTRPGEVVALQRDPDPETHTYALRIRLTGNGIIPGTLASTELPLQLQRDVLTVPVTAVLREDGGAYVFVVQEGRLERRPVTLGIREGQHIVVGRGLAGDERIVLRDVAALSDGLQVEVVDSDR